MAVSKKTLKDRLSEWKVRLDEIQSWTSLPGKEDDSEKHKRIRRLLKADNYTDFFEYYFPHYAPVPCADYHKEMGKILIKEEVVTLFNMIYRGGAKSTHTNIGVPLFLKESGQIKFMLLIGATDDNARILLSDLQAEFEANQRIINDFGKQLAYGDWSEGHFRTKDGVLFMAVGLNRRIRGLRNRQYRPDYLVVDDVDDREVAENQTRVRKYGERVLRDAMAAMGKSPRRVAINNNLIHRKGIMAWLLKKLEGKPNTHLLRVNALDERGNSTWSARFPKEHWTQLFASITDAERESEYFNNPIEEGKIFKEEWFERAFQPLPDPERFIQTICYADLSYEEEGCYKALVTMGIAEGIIYLLDCFVRQCTLEEAGEYAHKLHAAMPELYIQFYIEGNAGQEAMYEPHFNTPELGRRFGYIDIIWDKQPKGNKYNRIESTAAYYKRGDIRINEKLRHEPDFKQLLEQYLAFEKGSTAAVDGPDAAQGAISLLARSLTELASWQAHRNLCHQQGSLVSTGKEKVKGF